MLYSIEHLTKTFPMQGKILPVLQDFSLKIKAGEWIALTGPSGCGKTTLLQLLGGLDLPTSGRILLDDAPFSEAGDSQRTRIRRERIGFVFQSYQLFPELNALENVMLPALNGNREQKSLRLEAEQLLENLGLKERLYHRPKELSGGEQQRVAMARALINHPDIILADEPTGNLDRTAAQELIAHLEAMRQLPDADKEKGRQRTIIMVTHDLSLAAKADRQIQLKPCAK